MDFHEKLLYYPPRIIISKIQLNERLLSGSVDIEYGEGSGGNTPEAHRRNNRFDYDDDSYSFDY